MASLSLKKAGILLLLMHRARLCVIFVGQNGQTGVGDAKCVTPVRQFIRLAKEG